MTHPPRYTRPEWHNELANVLSGFVVYRDGTIDYDRAALSYCRRGLGKKPMDEPTMWPYIAPVCRAVPGSWGQDAQDRVEAATHYALALYAWHQQSRDKPMHRHRPNGHRLSVGTAAARLHQALIKNNDPPDGVDRRFLAAVTAESIDELVGHLRALIPQLRQYEIPLDYLALADDLVGWTDPDRRARIRRRWGLDYRWAPAGKTPDNTPEAETPTDDQGAK